MALVFLKLGGSLITEKGQPYTPRFEKLADLAKEIDAARRKKPDLRLVLGHGSGSFGHVAAQEHHFQRGAQSVAEWRGFAEVWYQATRLNRLVIEALHDAGLPIITFSPVASVLTHEGKIFIWDLYYIQAALEAGLIPVVHGDVVFDQVLGGTIVSTETLFVHLARALQPERILLAGREEGIWEEFPRRTRLIPEITPAKFQAQQQHLRASLTPDVTGGMLDKVNQMLGLVQELPDLQVLIFSGDIPGNVQEALLGKRMGSVIRA